MKKNKKNNTLFYTLVAGTVIATSLGLIMHKKNLDSLEDNSSIIVEEGGDNTGTFSLNYSKIQSRKIGDEFTLVANINENATFQSVTFEISDSTALEIVKKTNNSLTVKRIKDFEDYVIISVSSDDPFVNEIETCSIRCYNNFTGFDYLYVNKISDSSTSYPTLCGLCDEDEIILKKGLTYECAIVAYSTFSYLNGETAYKGNTQVELEEDTIESIRTSLTNIFGTLLSFKQDLSEFEANLIRFSFKYDGGFTFYNNTLTKVLSCEDYSLTITLTNYIEQSFLLNEQDLVVL